MEKFALKTITKITVIVLMIVNLSNGIIEQVDDTDLVHLLTGEENVVALFTKTNCPDCDEWETVIENIKKDLKDTIGAIVVKAQNSQLVGIYDPSKEPALVYFRRGIPLLYYGERNEDEILQMFMDNRDPVVKELSDLNFEHLTQASTGATTGDWFLFFYSADCILCQRLYAVWEAVGAKLRHRLNVARINRIEGGISTAKRFGIRESPEFLLLRLGKVYRYKSKEYTPKSFIAFAESEFRKQTHPEDVPGQPSFMNDFLSSQLKGFLATPDVKVWSLILLVFILVLFVIVKYIFASKEKPQAKTKKQK